MTIDKLKVGVSSCLLGERVRHDGHHKKNDYLLSILSPYVEFVPCCPEVAIGLGVPRPTIRLIGDPRHPQLVHVQDYSVNLTEKMSTYAHKQSRRMHDLDGYIFKKDSPTCGVRQVKVYQDDSKPPKMGTGIFAKVITESYPLLPVEDEGRLNDAALRENFIERLFFHRRLKKLMEKPSPKSIVEFHTNNKYALMAHSPIAYNTLGRQVAALKQVDVNNFVEIYALAMMKAFTQIATRKKNANVLQHIYGYFKKILPDIDRTEMCYVIDQYRQGLLPLIVPITLIRHHLNHYPMEYIEKQTYLYPYPNELMLRNAI